MKITRLDPRSQQPTADTWTLSRASRLLVIGRNPPADIRLDSPDVSPRHAELAWQINPRLDGETHPDLDFLVVNRRHIARFVLVKADLMP